MGGDSLVLRLCYVFVFFCFFFFKQKTAYEMRISDWSSDVCSSDLLFGDQETMRDRTDDDRADRLFDPRRAQCGLLKQTRLSEQIGRASCRERVCQYV